MTIVASQALKVLLHKASVAREVHWVAALHCLVHLLRDNVQCDIRPENCLAHQTFLSIPLTSILPWIQTARVDEKEPLVLSPNRHCLNQMLDSSASPWRDPAVFAWAHNCHCWGLCCCHLAIAPRSFSVCCILHRPQPPHQSTCSHLLTVEPVSGGSRCLDCPWAHIFNCMRMLLLSEMHCRSALQHAAGYQPVSLFMPEQQCQGTSQAQCMVCMGAYISLSLPDGPALLSLPTEPSA